jgi:hypothetical protein
MVGQRFGRLFGPRFGPLFSQAHLVTLLESSGAQIKTGKKSSIQGRVGMRRISFLHFAA